MRSLHTAVWALCLGLIIPLGAFVAREVLSRCAADPKPASPGRPSTTVHRNLPLTRLIVHRKSIEGPPAPKSDGPLDTPEPEPEPVRRLELTHSPDAAPPILLDNDLENTDSRALPELPVPSETQEAAVPAIAEQDFTEEPEIPRLIETGPAVAPEPQLVDIPAIRESASTPRVEPRDQDEIYLPPLPLPSLRPGESVAVPEPRPRTVHIEATVIRLALHPTAPVQVPLDTLKTGDGHSVFRKESHPLDVTGTTNFPAESQSSIRIGILEQNRSALVASLETFGRPQVLEPPTLTVSDGETAELTIAPRTANSGGTAKPVLRIRIRSIIKESGKVRLELWPDHPLPRTAHQDHVPSVCEIDVGETLALPGLLDSSLETRPQEPGGGESLHLSRAEWIVLLTPQWKATESSPTLR